ncbi:MAG: PfkB family carbohydrate kinase, partial [Erysipelotrichaceae bacterium]|nr:PfkB family carbohydrate kinase [Erysipelotrichaceae bacterium]
GANTIVLSAGSNACVKEEQVISALEEFESGDWLLLQNEINNPERLIEKAYEKGMKIILNPSPFNEKLEAADFSKLAWLIVNDTEAQQVSGKTDPEEVFEIIHQQYPALSLVLTLGEEGSTAWQVQEQEITVCRQAAFRVSAVDTTGAGDTFTGYFVQALMAGMPLETCMKRAAAAAALSVTKPSAAASIPSIQEVEAFLEKERGRI